MDLKEPYAFVSYSHDDIATVAEDVAWLREQGFNVYSDIDCVGMESIRRHEDSRVSEEDWQEKVEPAIERAAVFLFLGSENSFASPWCQREFQLARRKKGEVEILLCFVTEVDAPPGWRLAARETLHRHRGNIGPYRARLVAELAACMRSEPVARYAFLGPGEKVTVVPFRNPDGRFASFAQRIAHDIFTLIDFQDGIHAISKRTLFGLASNDSPVSVGQAMGADKVVAGSVTGVAEGRVQCDVEIIRCEDGEVQQTNSFLLEKHQSAASFGDQICQWIAESFHTAKSQSKPRQTEVDEAYSAFVEGQAHWYRQDPNGLRDAADAYRRAIGLDPGYVDAYIALAKAYLDSHSAGIVAGPEADQPAAFDQDLDALALAESAIADGHQANRRRRDKDARQWLELCQAYCNRIKRWNVGLDHEESVISAMIQANPANHAAYGEYGEGILMISGLYDEAIQYLLVSATYEPENWAIARSLAMSLACAGRIPEALSRLDRILERDPDNRLSTVYRTYLHIRQRNAAAAREGIDVLELANPQHMALLLMKLVYRYRFEDAAAALNDLTSAIEPFKTGQAPMPFLIGLACLIFQRVDEGLLFWEKADDQRDRLLHHAKPHLAFFCEGDVVGEVEAHPRYRGLMERIRIGESWTVKLKQNLEWLNNYSDIRFEYESVDHDQPPA